MASRSAKDAAARAAGLTRARRVRRRKDGSREIRYSEDLAHEICERIGRGEIWSRIGGTDGLPAYSTLFRWKAQHPEFAEAFALARAASNAVRADEVLAVSMRAVPHERLASLEQRLSDHESRCEERLGEIKRSAAHTLKAVEGLKTRFWVIAVSMLAWAMAQVWAGSQARISHLEGVRAAVLQEVADVSAR